MMKKLRLKEARTSWKMGRKIYLKTSRVPVSVVERSEWISWFIVDIETSKEKDFDKIVNAFAYYNCCEELGLVVHYYIVQPKTNRKPYGIRSNHKRTLSGVSTNGSRERQTVLQ
jgi:hypothetical protein